MRQGEKLSATAEVGFLKTEPQKPSFRFLNFEVGSVRFLENRYPKFSNPYQVKNHTRPFKQCTLCNKMQVTTGSTKKSKSATCDIYFKLASSMLRDDTRSRARLRVFFRTSRSGADKTLRMSITSSCTAKFHGIFYFSLETC